MIPSQPALVYSYSKKDSQRRALLAKFIKFIIELVDQVRTILIGYYHY